MSLHFCVVASKDYYALVISIISVIKVRLCEWGRMPQVLYILKIKLRPIRQDQGRVNNRVNQSKENINRI